MFFSDGKPRHRLSPQDISFLYLESDQAPMTIGSIAFFEGEIDYDDFVQNIESRLHIIPRYQQHVVEAPLGLARPTWEFDPDFDIRRHIRTVDLPLPVTDTDVERLAGKIFRGRMDRSRPLWEMHMVHGLEGGRTALISRVHHCMVDGVGGVELLMVTLDTQPDPPAPQTPPALEQAPPPPLYQRLGDAVFARLSEAVDRTAGLANWLVDLAEGEVEGTRRTLAAAGETLSYLRNPVHKFPFNTPFGGGRELAFLEIPWVGVKSIRKAFGGTVNDVVLSALGGALAAYAEHYGESIQGRTARIAVPVNVRRDSERAALGNRISMLAVEVPLDAAPVERLRAVVQNTDALKRERTAEGVGALMEMMGVLSPNALKSLAATLAMPNGISNAVCTNVPGPVMPLYTVGRRLLTHYAVMPIAWDMGVGCAVMSYHGHLYLTLVADTAAMGDVKLLREMMHRSFAALYRESAVPDDRLPKAEETEARVVAA